LPCKGSIGSAAPVMEGRSVAQQEEGKRAKRIRADELARRLGF
jgi:hypothetical protein